MSRPKSANLFHFTKSLDYLKGILANGLHPRYCLEDISWFGLDEHVAYPMVCFCDIPLSRIQEHTKFYGQYGLGFSKEWGLKNRLDPVIYCTQTGFVRDVAEFLVNEKESEAKEEKYKRDSAFWKLLKLVKPLSGNMLVNGEPVEKEFYLENEWRYTPSDGIEKSIIFQGDFEKERDQGNLAKEEFKLQFSPTDIKYIFVQQDSDIPEIVDFINNNLGRFPLNDLKILNSRIVSLRTIENDL